MNIKSIISYTLFGAVISGGVLACFGFAAGLVALGINKYIVVFGGLGVCACVGYAVEETTWQ
jgi:hypothetical protein